MNTNTSTQKRPHHFLVLYGLAAFLLAACGGDPAPGSDVFAKSPKGISFRSSVPIPSDVLSEADRQIDQLLVRARANGLTDTRSHRAVSIQILPRAAQCQTPGFLIHQNVTPGTNYDGTEYDLDPAPGVVSFCAAGRYLEREDLIQVTLDGIRQMPVVRYEGEHWILFHHDRVRYDATKIHNAGNLHPILGD